MCFILNIFSWSWFAFLLMMSFTLLMKFYLSFFSYKANIYVYKRPQDLQTFSIFSSKISLWFFWLGFTCILYEGSVCVYFFPKWISCCCSISFEIHFCPCWIALESGQKLIDHICFGLYRILYSAMLICSSVFLPILYLYNKF